FSVIFNRLSRAVLLLGFLVFGAFSAASVQAQEVAKDPKAELKSSLTNLSDIYKKEVERLEKRQQQSKELFNDGLISRVEFEKGEKELADARTKVEQVTNEIATASQSAPVNEIVAEMVAAGNKVWSTGNTRIDGLIRQYGKQYGVDPFLIYCTMTQESSFSAGATS